MSKHQWLWTSSLASTLVKRRFNDKGVPLTESDINLFKRYGKGPYTEPLKKVEGEIKELNQQIVNLQGIKESDTGLSMPS